LVKRIPPETDHNRNYSGNDGIRRNCGYFPLVNGEADLIENGLLI